MILFSFLGYENIARELREAAPLQVGRFAVNRYANRELHASIEGSVARCEAVMKAAGMQGREIPYFEKRRTKEGIVHSGPIGRVGAKVVIVDDMIDTGVTAPIFHIGLQKTC